MIRTLKFWIAVFLFAQVLDVASTTVALRMPGFVELNPLIRILGGWTGMWIVKGIATILALLISWRLNKECADAGWSPLGTYILAAVTTVTLLAGMCNTIQTLAAVSGWQGFRLPMSSAP